jgi:hypothetical protein
VKVQSATVESATRRQPVPNVAVGMSFSMVDASSINVQPRTASSARPIAPPSAPPAQLVSKLIPTPTAKLAASRVRP